MHYPSYLDKCGKPICMVVALLCSFGQIAQLPFPFLSHLQSYKNEWCYWVSMNHNDVAHWIWPCFLISSTKRGLSRIDMRTTPDNNFYRKTMNITRLIFKTLYIIGHLSPIWFFYFLVCVLNLNPIWIVSNLICNVGQLQFSLIRVMLVDINVSYAQKKT